MTVYSQPRPRTSWGRVSRPLSPVAEPYYRDLLQDTLINKPTNTTLAVGLGRSYGDSVLNTGGSLIDMTHLNRIISFDPNRGIIHAEAGASLTDILGVIVPRGWFLKTTPGTRFVTLGGALANDIHGKNHHMMGSIGCSVRSLQLLRSDKDLLNLSASENQPLFAATIGGMGLTGIISTVELQLAKIGSAYLDVERVPFGHIRDFFSLATESENSYEHTVAWIDCASGKSHLGRGIFQRANWSKDGELTAHVDRIGLSMPVNVPGILLNGLTIRAFNSMYYNMQKHSPSRQRIHYEPFFYPLDAIRQWNRLYGKNGFYQYQCVIPPNEAPKAIEEMLKQIARAGTGSFLAVLKMLGPIKSPGLMSFPIKGTTLALDFPNKGKKTLTLLGVLDDLMRELGGRLYPAKDGRMPAEMFASGYPALSEFRQHVDPAMGSDFWTRVSA